MPAASPTHWDVAVAGGGTAGIAAAISAARAGASTLLLERGSLLGGNASLAFVHTFCGLYLPPVEGRLTPANPGFASRLALWLQEHGGALPPEIHGKSGILPILPERLPGLLQKATAAHPKLTVHLQTNLTTVQNAYKNPNNVVRICVRGNEGMDPKNRESPLTLEWETPKGPGHGTASILIDTTGDGQAAALLGADFLISPPEELQHPTFIFRVSGANPEDLKGYKRLQFCATVARGCKAGRLPAGCESVLVRPTEFPGHALISLNLPKPEKGYNPLDPACLAGLQTQAQAQAEELITFFRAQHSGWEHCSLAAWPERVGIRETRRVRGCYVVTENDILTGRSFEDGIAVSTWPIELWNRHTGADFQYPSGPSQVPLRALVSATHPRLGMAGRCVSATHTALGALRVMGTGLAMGEAAGLAAALAARQGCALDEVRAQDVMELRRQIHETAGDTP